MHAVLLCAFLAFHFARADFATVSNCRTANSSASCSHCHVVIQPSRLKSGQKSMMSIIVCLSRHLHASDAAKPRCCWLAWCKPWPVWKWCCPLPPLSHIWDVVLVWRKGSVEKMSLCYSIVYYYNGVQKYERYLHIGRLYRALILLGLALYLPTASVSSVFMVLCMYI